MNFYAQIDADAKTTRINQDNSELLGKKRCGRHKNPGKPKKTLNCYAKNAAGAKNPGKQKKTINFYAKIAAGAKKPRKTQ